MNIRCTITGAYQNCKNYIKKTRLISENNEEYNRQIKLKKMSTAYIQLMKTMNQVTYHH